MTISELALSRTQNVGYMEANVMFAKAEIPLIVRISQVNERHTLHNHMSDYAISDSVLTIWMPWTVAE